MRDEPFGKQQWNGIKLNFLWKGAFVIKASPSLRKQNQIKTIHSSLKIEGNTLTQSQITDIIENKQVIGPPKDIKEVQNAIAVYEAIGSLQFHSLRSFLKAHKMLMEGLLESPGTFRKKVSE